jgi:hypothetical protein
VVPRAADQIATRKRRGGSGGCRLAFAGLPRPSLVRERDKTTPTTAHQAVPEPRNPGCPDLDHVDVESRRSAMSVPAKWVILEIFEYRIVVPKQLGELCLKVDRGHGQTLTLVTVGAGRLLGRIGFARPPPDRGARRHRR